MLKYLLSATLIILLSCKNGSKYNYAIKDFRESFQPHLNRIVSKAIVLNYDSALRHMATDEELKQLSRSEHPILRASAFCEMLDRNSFNHFDVIMDNLDDTATVVTDAGEFGVNYQAVSDYVLEQASWKTQEEKNKTIDKVLTQHNYLQSAYFILEKIEALEKYYPYIKDMATRIRKYDPEYKEAGFKEKQYALYGLAKFKKKQDIPIIKQQLLKYYGHMDAISFQLMKEFPDTSYLEIYEAYYPKVYNRSINFHGADEAIDFIESIAVYKNKRSAAILDAILNKGPEIIRTEDSYIKERLIHAIWNNECEAYSKLRKQVAKSIQRSKENTLELLPPDFDEIHTPVDTSERRIYWLR